MRENTGRFTTRDGTTLHYRSFRPETSQGTVVIVHGATEHGGRYGWLVESLVAEGFNCVAPDQRGHGHSGGRRGDVTDFATYAADLREFLNEIVRSPDGPRPFLFGHSMGTLVVLQYAAHHPEAARGIMLASVPARLAKAPPTLVRSAARWLARLFPRLPVPHGIAPENVSHDPEVVRRLRRDPLVHRHVSLRWSVELLDAIAQLPRIAADVRTPAIVLHGEADPIADIEGARQLAAQLGSRDKTFLSFPGLFHELHNEDSKGRDEVFATIVAWLKAHCAQGGDNAAAEENV